LGHNTEFQRINSPPPLMSATFNLTFIRHILFNRSFRRLFYRQLITLIVTNKNTTTKTK